MNSHPKTILNTNIGNAVKHRTSHSNISFTLVISNCMIHIVDGYHELTVMAGFEMGVK